ncbi:hypothetical protein [Ornithobacterium rhinotracheale]|uniref:hypothetical protein n=1 Tax=Ornithobacterium rhinotracheale TaxID=28251 RepID=UPI001FBC0649|nr:hypothetical protein [Ornithobacterium rhinotracheale]MCK0203461.1 hypothetical protein [Ornithobacterium rhinotracheale]UOH66376.1 hypothetical protein MT999_02905 [Ornithobacterium rhinotracheale]
MKSLKIIVLLFALISFSSCRTNGKEEAINTAFKILESIERKDYESFQKLLIIPENEYNFESLNEMFSDSVIANFDRDKVIFKDTIFPFNSPFNIKINISKFLIITFRRNLPRLIKR